jgi:hypothetical protein
VNKQIVVTAVVVWLLISFVPQLSLANWMGKGGKRSGG